MPKMVFWRRIALVASLTGLVGAPSASAATPAAVDLRIEGPTTTLYEGRVTADVAPFQFTGDPATHACDGTSGGGGGTSPAPVTVRNNAITAAGSALTYTGTWFSFGPAFATINGVNVDFDPVTNRFLAEYKNGQFASTGGCSDPVADGDSALYAYGDGSETLLGLTGPSGTVRPGATVTLTVNDLGAPGTKVAGASVGGGTSAVDGTVTVGPLAAGPTTFKATKAGTIRSNTVTVCATDGADGFCGTTTPGTSPPTPPAPGPTCISTGRDGLCGSVDTTAPIAVIKGLREQAMFRRGNGPKTLAGTVPADPAGLKEVRMRITRRVGPKCSYYDGELERLVSTKTCGVGGGTYFSIGDRADWSYLLPFVLPRGRYVVDVQTVDKAGNTSTPGLRGRNQIVFTVK